VFPLVESVGRRVLGRLGFGEGDALAFAESTHALVFRLLSCFPHDARVVSTTSEFHSLYRQLRRLEEDGLRVSWVDASSREGLADRLLAAAGSDLFMLSAVLSGERTSCRARRIVAAAVPAATVWWTLPCIQRGAADWGPAAISCSSSFAATSTHSSAKVCFLRFPATCYDPASPVGSLIRVARLPRGAASGRGCWQKGGASATLDRRLLSRERVTRRFDRHGCQPSCARCAEQTDQM
jgi:hypothetical protein